MKFIAALAFTLLVCGCIDDGCPDGQRAVYGKDGCVNETWFEKTKTVHWGLSSSSEIEKIYLPEENVTCFRSIQLTFSCVEGKR